MAFPASGQWFDFPMLIPNFTVLLGWHLGLTRKLSTDIFPRVGISNVNMRFHPRLVLWYLGIAWKIPSPISAVAAAAVGAMTAAGNWTTFLLYLVMGSSKNL